MPDLEGLDDLDELAVRFARREKAMLLANARGTAHGIDWKPWLIPILTLALGSAGGFIVSTISSSAKQSVTLENQQKLVDELRQHTITRDTFDATIRPMQSDIADIKQTVEALHRARLDDKVTYRSTRFFASN